MDVDKYIVEAIKNLSSMVTNDNIQKKDIVSLRSCELTEFRKNMGIPFLVGFNTFGKDLSLLNLSNKIFTDCTFKDYYFAGCNLSKTKFIRCRFTYCCFVGADMSGTEFNRCELIDILELYQTKANQKIKMINVVSNCISKFEGLI